MIGGDLSQLIVKPTLLLDPNRAMRNIEHMATRADHSGVRLRPHFKTHQAAAVGAWFRARGVTAVTVSSVDMAAYFADHGWDDITIAFPANVRQHRAMNDLAQRVRLGLLVESVDTAVFLGQHLTHFVDIWLKIDVGYQRTGLDWQDEAGISAVAVAVAQFPHLRLTGLLTHAGHTYHAQHTAITDIYQQTVTRLQRIQASLQRQGYTVALSLGDTPSCSLVETFSGIDEIRPGNFVFYDVMQWQLGACREEDIAVALACPVVAKHASRQQIVIYGGAVHLSKEMSAEGDYGRIAHLTENGWSASHPTARVISLSQEHGIVQADAALFAQVNVGDLLVVLPVHSCLTANLNGRYLTLNGDWLEMARF
ncbi:MAG: alanine racemase [Anaerolinea sp.]|nr:alanine racemase [Anaerolinea sp.]